jgi:hypothetical protein
MNWNFINQYGLLANENDNEEVKHEPSLYELRKLYNKTNYDVYIKDVTNNKSNNVEVISNVKDDKENHFTYKTYLKNIYKFKVSEEVFKGKDKKYHYLYLIIDHKNKKLYIGIHSTYDLNDNYMGSGKELKKAKEKHGLERFEKVILSFHNTRKKLELIEHDIIERYNATQRKDFYNLSK